MNRGRKESFTLWQSYPIPLAALNDTVYRGVNHDHFVAEITQKFYVNHFAPRLSFHVGWMSGHLAQFSLCDV